MENNNQTNFNFALQHEQHDKRHQELQKRAIYGTCKYPNCGGVCDSRLTPNIPDKYGDGMSSNSFNLFFGSVFFLRSIPS